MAAAKTTTTNPLTVNDIAGLRAVVDTYDALVQYIHDCHDCKMDFTSILEQATAYRDFAVAALSKWGDKGADANV